MKSKVKRLPKSEIEIIIKVPAGEVKKAYEKVLVEVVAKTEIKGFRKGKAPKKVVEKSVDKGKLYEQVISEILPRFYSEAVKEHNLAPIVNPKITPVSVKEGEDWEFKALICETPKVDLGDYKDRIKEKTAGDKIWVPGKEKEDEKEKRVSEAKKVNMVLEILLKNARVELAPVLVEEEVTRRLAQTLEEVKRLGLALEDYLRSVGKTVEQLKEEQRNKAEETLKLEFVLNKIAEEEKITVEEDDINKAINGAKTKEEKERLEANKYVLAMLLRRQKVLEFLKTL